MAKDLKDGAFTSDLTHAFGNLDPPSPLCNAILVVESAELPSSVAKTEASTGMKTCECDSEGAVCVVGVCKELLAARNEVFMALFFGKIPSPPPVESKLDVAPTLREKPMYTIKVDPGIGAEAVRLTLGWLMFGHAAVPNDPSVLLQVCALARMWLIPELFSKCARSSLTCMTKSTVFLLLNLAHSWRFDTLKFFCLGFIRKAEMCGELLESISDPDLLEYLLDSEQFSDVPERVVAGHVLKVTKDMTDNTQGMKLLKKVHWESLGTGLLELETELPPSITLQALKFLVTLTAAIHREPTLDATRSVPFLWDPSHMGSSMKVDSTLQVVTSERTELPLEKNSHECCLGSTGFVDGIHCWEFEVIAPCNMMWVGVATAHINCNQWMGRQPGAFAFSSEYGYLCTNTQRDNGPYGAKHASFNNEGDTVQVVVDLASARRAVWFGANGAFEASGVGFTSEQLPPRGTPLFPCVSLTNGGSLRTRVLSCDTAALAPLLLSPENSH
ncbi:hypothetical protein Pelo_17935 [Pelomyxa schiedti]|nr:hypothetical protein Pelo_17935 [Pelomyxa schiedti]